MTNYSDDEDENCDDDGSDGNDDKNDKNETIVRYDGNTGCDRDAVVVVVGGK